MLSIDKTLWSRWNYSEDVGVRFSEVFRSKDARKEAAELIVGLQFTVPESDSC